MQVTVESINPVTKKVCIEIPAERVDAEIEKSYAGIQKRAKLQGFRPGKAPLQLIKRTYSDAMRDEVMRRFYEQTLFKALDEHKIEPVDSPTIESDILEQGSPFKYSALVEIMPEILLNEYTGFEISKEKFILNPDNIEGEIKRMQENMAQLIPLDEGALSEIGHTVVIDYSLSVEGFPEENDTAENDELELGVNKMSPEFEEQLIGLKCGQQKEIRINLPDNYRNPEAAGKEATFQVTVNEIKRKELPELDDEFAQQFGDYETMDQLRIKLAEYMEKQETERIENELKERVIQALIRKNPLDVPQSMVKRQLEHMLENMKNRLKSQHMSIEMMGLDEDGFRLRFRESAEDKVKGGLLLMALVEKENISVNDDDLAGRYELIAGGNPDMLGRVRDYYTSNKDARNALASEIKEDKAIRFLLDNAVVTEVDAATLKAQ
ncbi:MAG: trigger factor [Desulfuromonadales bacterium]|nr:trigger factor [Desulfuromonadales bacterium]